MEKKIYFTLYLHTLPFNLIPISQSLQITNGEVTVNIELEKGKDHDGLQTIPLSALTRNLY